MKKYAAVLLAFCMLLSAVCAAAEGGAAEDSAVPVEKKTFPISYVCTKGENMVAAKRGCCLFFAFTFRFPSAYSGFGTGRASSGVYQE